MAADLFAGILYDAWRRYIGGSDPLRDDHDCNGLIAAAINAVCVWLLAKPKSDVNIAAFVTTISPRTSIAVAGGLVAWLEPTGRTLSSVIVAGIAAWGGIDILRDARRTPKASTRTNSCGRF